MTAQGKRIGIALAFVGACIVLPAASAVYVDVPGFSSTSLEVNVPQETEGGSPAYVLKNYSDSNENFAIGLYERLAGKVTPNGLPSNFEAEFFDPSALGRFDAYTGEGVAGLYWEEGTTASQSALDELLAQAGWQHIGVTEDSSSYVKESGVYRWLSMVVIEREGALSAVLNFREDM